MGIYKKKGSKYFMMTKCINGIKYFQSTRTKGRTEAQAVYERWSSELRHQVDTGGVVKKTEIEPAAETAVYFSELAERYLSYTNGRLKSHERLKSFIKTLMKYFKNIRLDNFSIMAIENMQSDIIKKGLSIAYANRLVAVLKRMLAKALDWEMLTEETLKKVRKVKLLKGEIKRLRYLSEEEAEKLVFNCELYLKPIVICALNTGMRKSEIFGLTWDRVDFRNRIILLDKTKNGERREIPINNTLFQALSGIVKRLNCKYVFYNLNTLKPFDNVKRSFASALRKSHVLDFHFHDLRHTFASRLVMAGVDLITVKELLGHKDIKMTLRYSHLSQAHVRQAISVLDKKSYLFLTSNQNGKIVNPEKPLLDMEPAIGIEPTTR